MARKIRWGGLVVSLMLVVAACGDDDDTGATGGDTTAAPSGETTVASTADTTPSSAVSETTVPIETGPGTVLSSGIPSGDSCENVAIEGVPGVSDTEVRIGGIVGATNPTSNPYGDSIDAVLAYIKGVNDAGGVCGRQITYVDGIDDQSSTSRNILAARQLVEEDDVFAILPVMTQNFGSAEYLVENGIPTFGWNIQVEWTLGENLFAQNGSYICFAGLNDDDNPGCPAEDWVWIAEQMGATVVGTLSYGSSPQSKACGETQGLSFGHFESDITVGLQDNSLNFGFTPEDLGPTIDAVRENGVDLLLTCMDLGGNVRILEALQNAGLDTQMYWPNGYDQAALEEFGDQIKNRVWTGTELRPFEVPQPPGGLAYQNSMAANDLPISEYTLAGWINADMLVTGIRAAAAGNGGVFDRQSVIDALNNFGPYSAGGIVPGVDFANDHGTGPSTNCAAYLEVDGASKTFVPIAEDPTKPWTCFDLVDPDPEVFTFESYGDEDLGLSTEGVEGTAEVEAGDGGTAEQPDDIEAAGAEINAVLLGYFRAETIDERLAVIANGESVRELLAQVFAPPVAFPAEVEIIYTSKTTADLKFKPELNGTVLNVALTSYVVQVDGVWLMHPFAACDLLNNQNPALARECLGVAEPPE